MTYLLDTDICIYALKGRQIVIDRLSAHNRSSVAVSVMTEAELRYGAARSTKASKMLRELDALLSPLTVLEFNSDDAAVYATVRAALARAGTPIGPVDTLIAAQARARNLVMVTNNEREYRRVKGLRVENWAI